MNYRERLENTIVGNAVDHVPAALWSHFPGDDQRAADFARAIVYFQKRYQWDMTVVHPPSTYQAVDYGGLSDWQGAPNGDRTITRFGVERSLAWTELRKLDPKRGETGKYLETIRQVRKELGEDGPPILLTIYSPLAQAERIAGATRLFRHMRTRPDRLRSGLNIITDNTLRFIEELKRTPLAGLCYVVEHANYDRLSEAEYQVFGAPYDKKILSALPEKWWLNILSVQGQTPMFTTIKEYPVQVWQWDTTQDTPGIAQGKSQVRGAVCGGVAARHTLLLAGVGLVHDQSREAIREANGRRFILGAETALFTGSPTSNLKAVRDSTKSMYEGI